MNAPDPRRKSIDAFNRTLDARLSGDANAVEPVSPDDLAALDIALRLAALNPSLDSRKRYPLRRRMRILAMTERSLPRQWAVRLRSSKGLSLALALVFVCAWVLTGLSVSAGSRPATPTAYSLPQTASFVELPPQSSQPMASGFSPQPIPTPFAPAERVTGTLSGSNTGSPRQTPALTVRYTVPVSASPITP